MNYSKEFTASLEDGKTMVRKIWKNPRRDGQYTVQVMQELETQSTESNLIAIAQGIDNKPRVTALLSFKGDALAKRGIDVPKLDAKGMDGVTYCFEGEPTLEAQTVFNGVDVEIQILENHVRNPYAESQQPKINPNTSEVLTKNGKAIYRHTSIVPKGSAQHEFIQHDTVSTNVDTAISEEAAMVATS